MAGGSHVDFNTRGFGIGAVSGAGIIASALITGVANARAASREHAVARAIAERDAIIDSLQRRIAAQARTILDTRREVTRLQTDLTDANLRLRVLMHLRNRTR